MIVLTSFREARFGEVGDPVSAARWSPEFAGDWPVVEWMRPLRPNGSAIRLRDFGEDPLGPYSEYLLSLYRDRWPAVRDWVRETGDANLAVACWCPYTRTARRQLERFGSFHCHLGVVGTVLSAVDVAWEFGPEHEAKLVRGE